MKLTYPGVSEVGKDNEPSDFQCKMKEDMDELVSSRQLPEYSGVPYLNEGDEFSLLPGYMEEDVTEVSDRGELSSADNVQEEPVTKVKSETSDKLSVESKVPCDKATIAKVEP